MRFRLLSLAGLVAMALAAGCTADVSTSPAPPPPPPAGPVVGDGTLVLDWTINGTTDPNQCYQSSAAAIAVDVTDVSGAPAGTFQQACTTFATSITLAPGQYTANARLIDANGNPRTTAVPINPFTINGNDQLSIPIDFPSSSFL